MSSFSASTTTNSQSSNKRSLLSSLPVVMDEDIECVGPISRESLLRSYRVPVLESTLHKQQQQQTSFIKLSDQDRDCLMQCIEVIVHQIAKYNHNINKVVHPCGSNNAVSGSLPKMNETVVEISLLQLLFLLNCPQITSVLTSVASIPRFITFHSYEQMEKAIHCLNYAMCVGGCHSFKMESRPSRLYHQEGGDHSFNNLNPNNFKLPLYRITLPELEPLDNNLANNLDNNNGSLSSSHPNASSALQFKVNNLFESIESKSFNNNKSTTHSVAQKSSESETASTSSLLSSASSSISAAASAQIKGFGECFVRASQWANVASKVYFLYQEIGCLVIGFGFDRLCDHGDGAENLEHALKMRSPIANDFFLALRRIVDVIQDLTSMAVSVGANNSTGSLKQKGGGGINNSHSNSTMSIKGPHHSNQISCFSMDSLQRFDYSTDMVHVERVNPGTEFVDMVSEMGQEILKNVSRDLSLFVGSSSFDLYYDDDWIPVNRHFLLSCPCDHDIPFRSYSVIRHLENLMQDAGRIQMWAKHIQNLQALCLTFPPPSSTSTKVNVSNGGSSSTSSCSSFTSAKKNLSSDFAKVKSSNSSSSLSLNSTNNNNNSNNNFTNNHNNSLSSNNNSNSPAHNHYNSFSSNNSNNNPTHNNNTFLSRTTGAHPNFYHSTSAKNSKPHRVYVDRYRYHPYSAQQSAKPAQPSQNDSSDMKLLMSQMQKMQQELDSFKNNFSRHHPFSNSNNNHNHNVDMSLNNHLFENNNYANHRQSAPSQQQQQYQTNNNYSNLSIHSSSHQSNQGEEDPTSSFYSTTTLHPNSFCDFSNVPSLPSNNNTHNAHSHSFTSPINSPKKSAAQHNSPAPNLLPSSNSFNSSSSVTNTNNNNLVAFDSSSLWLSPGQFFGDNNNHNHGGSTSNHSSSSLVSSSNHDPLVTSSSSAQLLHSPQQNPAIMSNSTSMSDLCLSGFGSGRKHRRSSLGDIPNIYSTICFSDVEYFANQSTTNALSDQTTAVDSNIASRSVAGVVSCESFDKAATTILNSQQSNNSNNMSHDALDQHSVEKPTALISGVGTSSDHSDQQVNTSGDISKAAENVSDGNDDETDDEADPQHIQASK